MNKAQIAFQKAVEDFVVALSKEPDIDHGAIADTLEQAGKHLLIHSSAARNGVAVESLTDVSIILIPNELAEAVALLVKAKKTHQ